MTKDENPTIWRPGEISVQYPDGTYIGNAVSWVQMSRINAISDIRNKCSVKFQELQDTKDRLLGQLSIMEQTTKSILKCLSYSSDLQEAITNAYHEDSN